MACRAMAPRFAPLPTDLANAHALILAERAARLEAEADTARARTVNTSMKALIAHLKPEIEKLGRLAFGNRSERNARLLEQMELQLEELETASTEDELAAERAAAQTQTVKSFQRKRPSRRWGDRQL
jgi:transposase